MGHLTLAWPTLNVVPGRGTPKRNLRVPDELWRAALAKAEARGEVLAVEIRRFLERYIKREDK